MASNRKALCVGINQYENYPTATLQGCVNDVKNMKSVMTTYLGFTAADIVELTDSKATKANIMNGLKEMVADAKAGKYTYLIFSMSSHGTQVPDIHGDEPDKADEAFCPYDLNEKGGEWDKDHVIVDDELRDLFIQLPENVLVEVFLDTCHSGTGLKALDFVVNRKPRYLPPPSLEAFEKVDGQRSRGLYRAMMESGVPQNILWAGCRADQTSSDAKIGGTWNGAFTYYWCKEMVASKNKLSRSTILTKVRKDLKAGKYTQIPQLEIPATARKLPLP